MIYIYIYIHMEGGRKPLPQAMSYSLAFFYSSDVTGLYFPLAINKCFGIYSMWKVNYFLPKHERVSLIRKLQLNVKRKRDPGTYTVGTYIMYVSKVNHVSEMDDAPILQLMINRNRRSRIFVAKITVERELATRITALLDVPASQSPTPDVSGCYRC